MYFDIAIIGNHCTDFNKSGYSKTVTYFRDIIYYTDRDFYKEIFGQD